jgi:CBS domain-containing protein
MTDDLVREAPVVRASDPVMLAVERLLESRLPGLPVMDGDGRLCGIFGEREFFSALFPGYLGQLSGASFVTRSLEAALEKRTTCRSDAVRNHMTTEHVDVGTDFSDAQVAETFLHHRVLVLPVVADGFIRGVITRHDFFAAVARRFLDEG